MPISIDEFETVDAEEERSTSELIVAFLLKNSERAFTRSEIAEAIDRTPNTVGTNLSRLKNRGLVRHKQHYWALTDDRARLSDAIRFSDALSGLATEFGSLITSEEDAQAWSDAQPGHPHPSEGNDEQTTGESRDVPEARD